MRKRSGQRSSCDGWQQSTIRRKGAMEGEGVQPSSVFRRKGGARKKKKERGRTKLSANGLRGSGGIVGLTGAHLPLKVGREGGM